MATARTPRSKWADGARYAATIDRLLEGVRGFVVSHLPPGDRVLDACCGTGALAADLARSGREVVGVDLSPRHIDFARSRSDAADLMPSRLRFEVGDVVALPVPDEGPYDVAVTVLSLHEMPTEARSDVIDNLAKVAERIMIVDFAVPMAWNVAGLRNRAAELVAGWEHFSAFRDYSRRGGLTSLLDTEGLVIEHERKIDSGTLHVATVRAGR